MDATQASFMRDGLLGKLENENKAMMAMLEHVPDDKLGYKPHDGLKPFNELAHHVYSVGVWFCTVAATAKATMPDGSNPPAVPATKQELVDACAGINQEAVKMAAGANPDTLAKDVEFPGFGTFPAVTFVDWHISHLIHHRAQLGMYLRMMGAKVPATYGDSLDYPMEM